jgi:hypothetical protein
LMSMMLCVVPVSTRMWTPVSDTIPVRYIGGSPELEIGGFQ